MKKHIKPLIICISSKHSDVGLIASDIESLAKWECVSSSVRVDGNGDSFVKATWF